MTNIRLPNAPSSSLPAQPDRGSGRMPSASSARRSQAGLCLTPAPVVKYWPEMMARPIWGAYPLDFPGGLVVQTQCLHCRAWVWFLVREVRSLRPCTAKKKETFKSNEHVWASQVVPVIKSLPANAGDGRDTGLSLGQEDRAPGEGMAPHSSILAWRISGTQELGGLQSMGLQRVGHDWSDLAHTSLLALIFFS